MAKRAPYYKDYRGIAPAQMYIYFRKAIPVIPGQDRTPGMEDIVWDLLER